MTSNTNSKLKPAMQALLRDCLYPPFSFPPPPPPRIQRPPRSVFKLVFRELGVMKKYPGPEEVNRRGIQMNSVISPTPRRAALISSLYIGPHVTFDRKRVLALKKNFF